jgi:hypothetical protein
VHLDPFTFPLRLELLLLLLHLSLPLLKLKSLSVQCLFGSTLSLIEFSFCFHAFFGGCPLPLELGTGLELSSLTVTLVHLLLPKLNLTLLFSQYALSLHLKLFLLFLPHLFLHECLSLPLQFDLFLLGYEFLLLLVLLFRTLFLL